MPQIASSPHSESLHAGAEKEPQDGASRSPASFVGQCIEVSVDLGTNENSSNSDYSSGVEDEGCRGTKCFSAFGASLFGFSIMGLAGVIAMTLGVFVSELLDTFHESRGKTSLVPALMDAMYGVGGVITPLLASKLGLLKTFAMASCMLSLGLFMDVGAGSLEAWIFWHGVVAALGSAMTFMISVNVMYLFTPKARRGLCVGFAFSGGGVGTATAAPLLSASFGRVGLQQTMLNFAISITLFLVFWTIVVALLMRFGHEFQDHTMQPVSSDESDRSTEKRKVWEWFKRSDFSILFIAFFIFIFGFTTQLNHLPRYAEDLGYDPVTSARLLTVFGIANALGRALLPQFGDLFGGEYLRVLIFTFATNGIAIASLVACGSFISLNIVAGVCGFMAGGRTALLSLVCCQLFGQQNAVQTYGLLCSCFLLSMSFGSPVIGWIHDEADSYTPGWLLVGGMMTTAALICAGLECKIKATRRASGAGKKAADE
eukprot:CAMPEP_0206481586 /NCGR_PEP_ID=MMETSP0324_2-20121206/38247_1 /ASSEMBLY_ACC=CAM_ASM_000836 /TAXON_ID=2866 /ORGANISM="Crypthecodinium cohnii, Strain Seligo" /LENGTH=485 /DNA_ID=CAMNT_0053959131 /DNA_START=169 /DNA_END=1626 /DNA_ORIENTATION=+